MAQSTKSVTVVTSAGIAAAVRYGGLAQRNSQGQATIPSYGAKLQVSRIVVGRTEITPFDDTIQSIPDIVWDSRNPNDNPVNDQGEIPMTFLSYNSWNDRTMHFLVKLPESAGPFTIKTVGLYARDDSGEDILFSVTQLTDAVEKVTTTEASSGAEYELDIFIVLSGIARLFTEDGSPVVHPNPINIEPIKTNYATIPTVATEASLPLPATNSNYNVYHVERFVQQKTCGLAVRSGTSWNYVYASANENYNSFGVTASQFVSGTVLQSLNGYGIAINDSGKFCRYSSDSPFPPIGIYNGGRIYNSSGYCNFGDLLSYDLIPGVMYYFDVTGRLTDVETDLIAGKAISTNELYIDMTERRYATTTRPGLIQLATASELNIGENETHAVTPKLVKDFLSIQESPENAITSYFETFVRQNVSINRLPTEGNGYLIEVSMPTPKFVSGVGIQNTVIKRTYDLGFRRLPSSYPDGPKTNPTGEVFHSFEPYPIKLGRKWTIESQSSWNYNQLIPSNTDATGGAYANPDDRIQVGDWIYVKDPVDTNNQLLQITAINGSGTYESGAINNIKFDYRLALSGSDTYYLIKSPENAKYYHQYIKWYWFKNDMEEYEVAWDYITSYSIRPTGEDGDDTDTLEASTFDESTTIETNLSKVSPAWTDSLDKFLPGNLVDLNSVGISYPDSEKVSNVGYTGISKFGKYKLGEIVTVADTVTYDVNGDITSNNVPPEEGMIPADGTLLDTKSDLHKQKGLVYTPNCRTYNRYYFITPGPILRSTVQYLGSDSYNNYYTQNAFQWIVNGRTANNTWSQLYEKQCKYTGVMYLYLHDSSGNEGWRGYVNGVQYGGRLQETNGTTYVQRMDFEANDTIAVQFVQSFSEGAYAYIQWNKFQPNTITWVKAWY